MRTFVATARGIIILRNGHTRATLVAVQPGQAFELTGAMCDAFAASLAERLSSGALTELPKDKP